MAVRSSRAVVNNRVLVTLQRSGKIEQDGAGEEGGNAPTGLKSLGLLLFGDTDLSGAPERPRVWVPLYLSVLVRPLIK